MARFTHNLRSNKKLSFENMEARQMMAGDIAFNSQTGVLTITGDNYQDVARVDFNGSYANVVLESQGADGSIVRHVQSERINNITRIEFDGNNGVNRFDVTQTGVLPKGVNLNGLEVLFQGGIDSDIFVNNTSVRSTAYGYYGNDELRGGSGVDRLFGEVGEDRIYGNLGADEIDGGDNNDWLYGGGGNDTIFGGNGVNRIFGEDGVDTLIGGDEVDFILGGVGNDTIEGRGGNDSVEGGNGDDQIYGGDGDDTLMGGNGYDRIFGGADNDTINGGYDSSIDYLEGNAGSDTFQSVFRRLSAGKWLNLHIDNAGDFGQGDILAPQAV